jgi:hypothetical protein
MLGAVAALAQDRTLTDSQRVANPLKNVRNCWRLDDTSIATGTVVTVRFALDENGRVVGNEVKLVSATEGHGVGAVSRAFETARRAVLRCQGNGYSLEQREIQPGEEFDMTFDPSTTALR